MTFRVRFLSLALAAGLVAMTPVVASLVGLPGNSLRAESPTPRRTPAELLKSSTPLVIGHRGASSVAPENTAASFREAIAANADLVELDYYVTTDGVHCVFHDKTLDRTTNARQTLGGEKIAVASRTWDDLRGLDAGTWFDPKFAGECVPRLEEALDLIQSGSVTLIERKDGAAEPLVEMLRDKKLVDRVAVQAFDWDFVADVARMEPDVALGALGSKTIDDAVVKKLASIDGIDFVGWSEKDLNAAAVAAFHDRGWRVFAYTVNDADRARDLVALGVDGIITDDPRGIGSAIRPAEAAGK